jgi:hypothetical protein
LSSHDERSPSSPSYQIRATTNSTNTITTNH